MQWLAEDVVATYNEQKGLKARSSFIAESRDPFCGSSSVTDLKLSWLEWCKHQREDGIPPCVSLYNGLVHLFSFSFFFFSSLFFNEIASSGILQCPNRNLNLGEAFGCEVTTMSLF